MYKKQGIARLAGEHGQPVLTPMMRLQDSEQTKVLIATLAETTPVLEAVVYTNWTPPTRSQV
nr:hypothetical protein [Salmonella enterica]